MGAAATIHHDEDRHRFALLDDGRLASFVDYVDRDGVRMFPHTQTFAEFTGRGYATRVVMHALRETVAAGLDIVPSCPFVRWVVEQHEEFRQSVAR